MTCTSSFCYGARFCWCVRVRHPHRNRPASTGSLSRQCDRLAPSPQSQCSCTHRMEVLMWLRTWDPLRCWEMAAMEAAAVPSVLRRRLSVGAMLRRSQHQDPGVRTAMPRQPISPAQDRHLLAVEQGALVLPLARPPAHIPIELVTVTQGQTIPANSRSRLSCSRLSCSRLSCSRLSCSRLFCNRLSRSRLSCSRLSCSRLSRSRLSCSHLSCSRLSTSRPSSAVKQCLR